MRLFAVGDIHGCATALDTVLGAISPRPTDRIVTLGDYINKGPDSKAVLDCLVRLSRWGILVPLLGNHELKFLIARRLGQAVINGEVFVDQHTLASYAPDRLSHHPLAAEVSVDQAAILRHIPDSHWQLLQDQGLRWFSTDQHIFLHGTLATHLPLLHQPDRAIFWDKLKHPAPHPSGKTLICGHTPQRSGYPLNLGHTVCLDTAACEGQWLTCLEVNSGEIWQANQEGHLRRSHLADYGPIPPTFPHRADPQFEGNHGLPAGPVPSWPTAACMATAAP
ncbi:hypothetical protein GFS31_10150 [Leptolyngbya sp. BL0902]|uniref:metallophosphoesterase n=1 Tax=Leptolyngbya sp. BL0902 TaxID=1115757 RepID=UPI0018E80B51|nr:metallophosphoesterase [Leptolyngbya sp. BL0902]QQE64335.1 hypothetical protein GFS31_10150 [Leptolyngbya sp. BL0902]